MDGRFMTADASLLEGMQTEPKQSISAKVWMPPWQLYFHMHKYILWQLLRSQEMHGLASLMIHRKETGDGIMVISHGLQIGVQINLTEGC